MKTKPLGYKLDTLPSLTDAQKRYLDELATLTDDWIDTGDIPELTEAQLAGMRRSEHYRPVKLQITARLDSDVLV